ncbi:hypothetical protein [Deinococcus arenicola]|uniref:Major facilitator superfamily (MFS) profile domain-containing protein n=1 Tax=Deinococcus arenicola TaxID=2994950 RepID=A0ABU4DL71_9DEIO|nr:hypothetical protein [Deinococcus sp. ZS9-10]MDV6373093.1 hypothetical protein [Deinococcus sp. ZS9-10]
MPQTRLAFFLTLLLRGVLYGLGASVLAALCAYFVTQRGWNGTASALNIAGIILWILGGSFIGGAFTGHGQEVGDRARVGQATAQFNWPLKDALLALIAGSVCFLLMWVGNLVLIPSS